VSTHGMSSSPEYRVWAAMKKRCLYPNAKGWENYGGRGIKVADRWLKFETFFSDMGARPTAEHSIERVDNGRGYEPGNCCWATPLEQANNRRRRKDLGQKGFLSPPQVRAARSLLGWSQEEFHDKCGGAVDLSTLKRYEAGKSDPKQSTLLVWERALRKAGVVLIEGTDTEGPGVRLREPMR
jgi:ribosome-binding protein aMBF1 (putative translation factor)